VSPLPLRAQQGKLPTIGFLGPATPSVARDRIAAFEQRLAELGWVNGRTVSIEYRWAGGNTQRFAELAAEFVRLDVTLLATWGTATAVAARNVTSVIPIVFTVVGDPVGSGLVASLARPGGNVTGLSTQHADAAGKRIELLREIVPGLRRLAVLVNAANSGSMQETREVRAAAKMLGVEIATSEIRGAEDVAPAIAALRGKVEALYVAADALMNTQRSSISSAALEARLPTMHGFREIVAAGGLVSYAPNFLDLFRRMADHVDKVLRGTRPAEIPVEQPTRFDLVINLKTAKALGLEMPPSLLARADEVIE
jgi:putative ABC transport system substrate-binding protein